MDAAQKWLKKMWITANESKSVHVTFTTWRESCLPLDINNVHLPEQDVQYLGLYLDRRLAWRMHIFTKRKQLEMNFTPFGYLDKSQNSPQATNSHRQSNTQTNLGLWNITAGYGFHFKHKSSRTVTM
jgi:hypothetical protein